MCQFDDDRADWEYEQMRDRAIQNGAPQGCRPMDYMRYAALPPGVLIKDPDGVLKKDAVRAMGEERRRESEPRTIWDIVSNLILGLSTATVIALWLYVLLRIIA